MLNIILLGITGLLTDISSEMVYPILPIYLVTRLGAGPVILGVQTAFFSGVLMGILASLGLWFSLTPLKRSSSGYRIVF